MLTLDEIQAQRSTREERAFSFQRVRNELDRLRKAVEQLTPKIDAITATMRQIDTIQQLGAQLAPDVQGKGGMRLRDQIAVDTAAAIKVLAQRREKEQRLLDAALAAIPNVEAQLKEFES